MKVLTREEYLISKEKTNKRICDINSLAKDVVEEKPPRPLFTWFLLHPENGVDDYMNFEDVINIDGKEYKRSCKNGIVKTDEDELAYFLIRKDYVVLDKIEASANKNWINEIRD